MKSIFFTLASVILTSSLAQAAEAPERVDVDGIKEKYWARGNETEMGVVQNRTYSKAGKFQIGLIGGMIASDPFLNVKSLGGTFGYHFNEYFSLHVLGFKNFVSPSSALDTFQQVMGATTNNNPQRWYLGGEAMGSLLYGKLSLLGKAIIYYDLHLLGGFGRMATDNGAFPTGHVGIGQQFYVNKMVSISVDYRLMGYNETLIEKVVTPRLGQEIGTRWNWNNSITFGVNFLWGFK